MIESLKHIVYNVVTNDAELQLDSALIPLADGMYQLTIEGDDANLALEDLSGNAIGLGQDQVFTFTVNNQGPTFDAFGNVAAPEGGEVAVTMVCIQRDLAK